MLKDRLRKCAEIAGSGDALAHKAGIPRSSLETYLTGKSEPKASRLAAICSAIGIDGHWLLTGDGTMFTSDGSEELVRQLEDIEQHLEVADLPVAPEKLRESEELGLLLHRLTTIAHEGGAPNSLRARAALLVRLAFPSSVTRRTAEAEQNAVERYREVQQAVEEVTAAIDYKAPLLVKEGVKTVMFSHGLDREGAMVLLQFLKAAAQADSPPG